MDFSIHVGFLDSRWILRFTMDSWFHEGLLDSRWIFRLVMGAWIRDAFLDCRWIIINHRTDTLTHWHCIHVVQWLSVEPKAPLQRAPWAPFGAQDRPAVQEYVQCWGDVWPTCLPPGHKGAGRPILTSMSWNFFASKHSEKCQPTKRAKQQKKDSKKQTKTEKVLVPPWRSLCLRKGLLCR